MAKKSLQQIGAQDTITVGGVVEIPVALLGTLAVDGFSRKGVILCDAREQVKTVVSGLPATVTVSLRIERTALTQDEQDKVDATDTERTAAKAAKVAAEQAHRESELKAAVDKTRADITAGVAVGQQQIAGMLPVLDMLSKFAQGVGR